MTKVTVAWQINIPNYDENDLELETQSDFDYGYFAGFTTQWDFLNLKFDTIQKVNSLQICLKMKILKIETNNNNKFIPNIANTNSLTSISGYTWNINDKKLNISPYFEMHGMFYNLKCQLNDFGARLGLVNSYLSSHICCIYIYFEMIHLESCTKYIACDRFDNNRAGRNWSWFLPTSKTSTFRLMLTMIDVFESNGASIAYKYNNNNNGYSACKLLPVVTHNWNIPNMCDLNADIIVSGYIQMISKYYIPPGIVKICILFYDNSCLVNEIKKCQNHDTINSDILSTNGLKFFMEIYPNGFSESNKGNFEWYLTLCSLSPKVKKIVFSYQFDLMEINDAHWAAVTICTHERISIGWPSETLRFQDIQKLNTFTLRLRMSIFEILDENGNTLQNNSKLFPQNMNAIIHPTIDEFEWKISDKIILLKIKNATESQVFDGPLFLMHGFKWFLRFVPNDINETESGLCLLAIRLVSIPPNVSTVAIKYTLMCLETNTVFHSNSQFDEEYPGTSWPYDRLFFKDLKDLNTLTLKIIITLIDVYDINGIPVTDQYMHKYPMCRELNHSMFETGIKQWKITDMKLIKQIKSSNVGDSFCCDMFKISGFKWVMEICPNGSDIDNEGDFSWYFHLISISPKISKIAIYFKFFMTETNMIDCDSAEFMVSYASCGAVPKLKFKDIQHLKSFTFDLQIWILDCFDEHGGCLNNYKEFQSKVDKTSSDVYEWKVTDEQQIKCIKSHNVGEKLRSKYFKLFGIDNWYLEFYGSGKDKDGCSELCFGIVTVPNYIQSISFYMELSLCDSNGNNTVKYSNFVHFKDKYLMKGWTDSRMKRAQLDGFDMFQFKVLIRLIDVHNHKGIAITDRFTD
eukprot:130265_1